MFSGLHDKEELTQPSPWQIKQSVAVFGAHFFQPTTATTNSNHALLIAENVLEPKFEIDAPNRAWVNDLTYIATAEGWLYLTGP